MLKRDIMAASAAVSMLAACGSEPAPGPVEQIVVRQPGEAVVATVASGEAAFAQCLGCHAAEAGAASGAGPNLYGVVGRKAAALKDFEYSDALAASGITWDAAKLDRFLADPDALVPGTYMAAGAVPDPEQRAAIVAHLETLGE